MFFVQYIPILPPFERKCLHYQVHIAVLTLRFNIGKCREETRKLQTVSKNGFNNITSSYHICY